MANEDKLEEVLDRVKQLHEDLRDISRQQLLQIKRILEILEPQDNSEEYKQLGYPALFLDAVAGQVFVKKTMSQSLEVILHGTEYALFHHIIEFLQIQEPTIHWLWGFIIWPEWCKDQPRSPKKTFVTYCSRLRQQVEKAWKLGPLLGKGFQRRGHIPIESKADYFFTDAKSEDSIHPVGSIFLTHDSFQQARKTQQWDQAHRYLRRLLGIDPGNWVGNTSLCWLALENHTDMDNPLIQDAITFIHNKSAVYEQALDKIKQLSDKDRDQEQFDKMCERLALLTYL